MASIVSVRPSTTFASPPSEYSLPRPSLPPHTHIVRIRIVKINMKAFVCVQGLHLLVLDLAVPILVRDRLGTIPDARLAATCVSKKKTFVAFVATTV